MNDRRQAKPDLRKLCSKSMDPGFSSNEPQKTETAHVECTLNDFDKSPNSQPHAWADTVCLVLLYSQSRHVAGRYRRPHPWPRVQEAGVGLSCLATRHRLSRKLLLRNDVPGLQRMQRTFHTVAMAADIGVDRGRVGSECGFLSDECVTCIVIDRLTRSMHTLPERGALNGQVSRQYHHKSERAASQRSRRLTCRQSHGRKSTTATHGTGNIREAVTYWLGNVHRRNQT